MKFFLKHFIRQSETVNTLKLRVDLTTSHLFGVVTEDVSKHVFFRERKAVLVSDLAVVAGLCRRDLAQEFQFTPEKLQDLELGP